MAKPRRAPRPDSWPAFPAEQLGQLLSHTPALHQARLDTPAPTDTAWPGDALAAFADAVDWVETHWGPPEHPIVPSVPGQDTSRLWRDTVFYCISFCASLTLLGERPPAPVRSTHLRHHAHLLREHLTALSVLSPG